MWSRIIFLLVISTALQINSAQNRTSPSPKEISFFNHPGHTQFNILWNDSLRMIDLDMTEPVDIIVQFKGIPLFIQLNNYPLKKTDPTGYKLKYSEFYSDLSQIYERAASVFQTPLVYPQKKMEYYKLFYGVSLRIPRAMLSSVASLNYVEKVFTEKNFKVNLEESVKIIGADSVWCKYNDQGDSILVAIIDTGIDYLHPALGGGFGKGFKVIEGYDFVNKDSDPMDDYGHGTHVAGIVAAEGENIKGVAPKALLMAYKVLDETGEGNETDIISAIERAADPNEDNLYNDKADIINLSLGHSAGGPDDPVSIAVNNASNIGIVVCTAAGNDGNYNYIGSPGSAAQAITVGAVDKNGRLTSFSSKGPAKKSYSIKPDILAPGLNIKSTILNGGYAEHSGTSMACPHIAGVCALLKHLHKEWTPEMIRSALITSAKDLGLDIMSQGSGEVNALSAAGVNSLVSPSSICFGLDDVTKKLWTVTNSFTVTNISNSEERYLIEVSGLISGITINISETNFSLSAGGSREIFITLQVDNSIVPDIGSYSHSTGGMITLKTGKTELHFPWAFLKSPKLILQFNKPVLFYDIYSSTHSFNDQNASNNSDLYNSELLVPPDKYNMLFVFCELKDDGNEVYSCVIKENVDLNKGCLLTINSEEADIPVDISGVDENGILLCGKSNSVKNINFACKDSLRILNIFFQLRNKQILRSSRFSKNITISAGEFQTSLADEKKVRVVQYPIQTGLEEKLTLKNTPSDFLKQNINISLNPAPCFSNAAFANVIRFNAGLLGDYIYYSVDRKDLIKEKVWKGTLFITPEINESYGYTTEIITDVLENVKEIYNEDSRKRMWFNTETLRTKLDSLGFYNFHSDQNTFFSPDNGVINLGDGVIFPDISGFVYKDGSNYKIDFGVQFFGQMKEFRISDYYKSFYSLSDTAGNIIVSDSLSKLEVLNVPEQKYRFIVNNNNYTVGNNFGKATLISEFDLSKTEHEAPRIIALKILNSRQTPVSCLERGENAKVEFYAANPLLHWMIDIGASNAYIRKTNSIIWEPVKLSKRPNEKLSIIKFCGDISQYTLFDSASYDLKITIQNFEGFKTDWILEPAFTVGNFTTTAEGQNTLSILPQKYMLYNNYPNPFNPATIISYDVPRTSAVEISVFDILGRKVFEIVKKEHMAGHYEIKFGGSNLCSGIYICRMKAQSYVRALKMLYVK